MVMCADRQKANVTYRDGLLLATVIFSTLSYLLDSCRTGWGPRRGVGGFEILVRNAFIHDAELATVISHGVRQMT